MSAGVRGRVRVLERLPRIEARLERIRASRVEQRVRRSRAALHSLSRPELEALLAARESFDAAATETEREAACAVLEAALAPLGRKA